MNITNIPIYKKYKEGTYSVLTTEERMFYVNLIKESDRKNTYAYSWVFYRNDWDNLPDDCNDVIDNIHDFFSDASKHINNKIQILSDFINKYYYCSELIYGIYDICPDFSNEFLEKRICSISYQADDILSIYMEYDQSAEDLIFDYRLLDENHLNDIIKTYLEKVNKSFDEFESFYKIELEKYK